MVKGKSIEPQRGWKPPVSGKWGMVNRATLPLKNKNKGQGKSGWLFQKMTERSD